MFCLMLRYSSLKKDKIYATLLVIHGVSSFLHSVKFLSLRGLGRHQMIVPQISVAYSLSLGDILVICKRSFSFCMEYGTLSITIFSPSALPVRQFCFVMYI
jgi:hypothetical protein